MINHLQRFLGLLDVKVVNYTWRRRENTKHTEGEARREGHTHDAGIDG